MAPLSQFVFSASGAKKQRGSLIEERVGLALESRVRSTEREHFLPASLSFL
jgi:hypothetical protein